MARFPSGRSFVQAATDAVRRSGHFAVAMADFAAVNSVPASYCQEQVRKCDIYIGIVGFRYGSLVSLTRTGTPPAGRLGRPARWEPRRPSGRPVRWQSTAARGAGPMSYTDLEFRTATEAALPRLLFLLDDEAPIPRTLTDRNLEQVDAFRERLRTADVTVASFTTADGLEASILHALAQFRRGESPGRTGPAPTVPPQPMTRPKTTAQEPTTPPTTARPSGDLLPVTGAVSLLPDGAGAGAAGLAVPTDSPADELALPTPDRGFFYWWTIRAGLQPGAPARGMTRRRLLLVGVAVVVALIAGLALGPLTFGRGAAALSCRAVASATALPAAETWVGSADGQCIGFSDGSYDFDPRQGDLSGLLGLIAKQNQAVAGQHPFTIIVAAPLTAPGSPADGYVSNSTAALGQGGMSELRGAQLAQAAVNAAGSSYGIQIRLVVANVGWQSAQAPTVAHRISAALKADPRLVGVLGLFQSTAGGKQAVALLNDSHIPIVSSTASDDGLTAPVGPAGHLTRRYSWYFRVGPTNRREAQAMVAAIPTIMARSAVATQPVRPLIVTSPNASGAPSGPDDYSDNLAADIRDELGKRLKVVRAPVIPFPATTTGTASAAADPSAVFGRIVAVLNARCADPKALPNLLVYTGRTTSVNQLLDALDQSSCEKNLPILAGDDAMELESDPQEIAQESNHVHPFYFADSGLSQPGDNPVQYAKNPDDRKAIQTQIMQMASAPGGVSGHTIVAFDATAVLAQAIHVAALSPQTPDAMRTAVAANLDRRCGDSAALTANGYISLNRYGDSTTAPVVIRMRTPAGQIFPFSPGGAAASFQPPTGESDCTFSPRPQG